jgi:ATP-binding cassette, subfamily B, multidrug efflux pump
VTTTVDDTGAGADDEPARRPVYEQRGGFGSRAGSAGMPTEKLNDFGGTVRRLLRRLGSNGAALAIPVLAISSVGLAVIGPRLLGAGTNTIVDGMSSPDGIDFGHLHALLLVAAACYLVSAALAWLQAWVLAGIVQRTMFRLRADVEAKLHRLPLRYVDGSARGDLLSRVTNDIDNISQSLQQTLSQLLTSTLTLIGVLTMMLLISPLLAAVTALVIPASLLLTRQVAKRSQGRFVAQWRLTGSLNAQIEEAFTGHSVVKVFGRRQEVEATFAEGNERLYHASFWAQFLAGTIQPAMMFLGNLNFVAIAVIGGLQVSSGQMSIGEVQAFIQYSRQFTQPLTQVAALANILQSGVASAERVFDLLDADEQSPDATTGSLGDDPRGRVEFDEVTFSYNPAVELITGLSLVADPGQTVAIVGHTGAGKTTLVNLIMRFYEIGGGTIRIDGVDIATIPRRELRSHIAMVLQDTWLFEGTIRDNIAYGRIGATEQDVMAAARATYVDRFVHSLPEGYDTIVDEAGSNLSAGERQLVTIARAFLADPAILILDEATSSVDTRTEVLIQRATAVLRSTRTSFIIAHRLSTIRDADVILVMDGGRIVEQGSHAELLARGGAYFTLYDAQFSAPATEVS